MNLRIQTYGKLTTSLTVDFLNTTHDNATDGTTVYDVLEKGFDDLMDLCDVVTDKFTTARDDFMTKQDS